jgi:phospholipid-binding lipoprotein MlaA
MQMSRFLSLTLLAALIAAPGPVTAANETSDPLEPFNRGIFWFNDKADVYVLEPVAKGWDWLAPDPVQTSLSNFFENLRFPLNFVNNLLQGKIQPGIIDVGRFTVNTTVGVLGFFDPATGWGLEPHNEDFGQTLGVWGVPPGPYLVLPLMGPSNIRDGTGLLVDSFIAVYPWLVELPYTLAATSVRTVNDRSLVLEEVREIRRSALDYYVFVRNAYTQHRRALVNDEAAMSKEREADLYFEDYDDDEE